MSVLDQLRALEQQVQRRLRELRPLVDEYRDLEKVAERLGLKREGPDTAATAAAKPAPRAVSKAKPSRARKPAAKARAKRAATTEAARQAAAVKPKAPAARGRSGAGRPSARKRAAAAPGQRQQDVLRLVRERPGITVAELARELGVDATGLYGVVRRLQSKGEISKDGTRLQPVSETTPSAAASTTAAPGSGAEPSPASADPRPEPSGTPPTES